MAEASPMRQVSINRLDGKMECKRKVHCMPQLPEAHRHSERLLRRVGQSSERFSLPSYNFFLELLWTELYAICYGMWRCVKAITPGTTARPAPGRSSSVRRGAPVSLSAARRRRERCWPLHAAVCEVLPRPGLPSPAPVTLKRVKCRLINEPRFQFNSLSYCANLLHTVSVRYYLRYES